MWQGKEGPQKGRNLDPGMTSGQGLPPILGRLTSELLSDRETEVLVFKSRVFIGSFCYRNLTFYPNRYILRSFHLVGRKN